MRQGDKKLIEILITEPKRRLSTQFKIKFFLPKIFFFFCPDKSPNGRVVCPLPVASYLLTLISWSGRCIRKLPFCTPESLHSSLRASKVYKQEGLCHNNYIYGFPKWSYWPIQYPFSGDLLRKTSKTAWKV